MSDLTYANFKALAERAASHPDVPVFKIPNEENPMKWKEISYSQFQDDIFHLTRFWRNKLTHGGVTMGAVVGLWIRGTTYPDVITIFSLSRAGFIPQLIPFDLPELASVLRLLSNASALIHAPEKRPQISGTSMILHFETVLYIDVPESEVADIALPILPPANPDTVIYIYHTSGSVSGIPKIAPLTNRWLAAVERRADQTFRRFRESGQTQDIWNWISPFAHAVACSMFQYAMSIGGCVVQASRYEFTPMELVDMIEHAGINRVFQFGMTVRDYLEYAKTEPRLLGALKGLRQYTYAGICIPREWEDWAFDQDIPLTTCFGCTEVGQMLTSSRNDRRLHVLQGVQHEFVPARTTSVSGTEYGKLFEFCIPPGSPDLPHFSLCNSDGGWSSGDLFEQSEPGKYIFRGRDDDWIKTYWADKIDAKGLEENVYATCSDLVGRCVVVGHARPFPALFVEPKDHKAILTDEYVASLKLRILKRIKDFHSNLYIHERITLPNMILVVPFLTLPRNRKGNVRRRAVEEQFRAEIEAMYASVSIDEVYAGVSHPIK